jgi:hypothetical protein
VLEFLLKHIYFNPTIDVGEKKKLLVSEVRIRMGAERCSAH